jgi:glutamyl-Q tRNA(Asp) synthetase
MGHYVGRFAPSPSGPLHFGSLVAAVASFLDARAHDGHWLLRIDDLDPPRVVEGASQQIITALHRHGLHWDGDICWQSQRSEHYRAALNILRRENRCYSCDCSRAQLADHAGVYPGTCRNRQLDSMPGRAIRVKVAAAPIQFVDLIQGAQTQRLEQQAGDFVLLRKDGLYAYQLAVVVDDAAQGINHVIRGVDLLESTGRQIYLQQLLNLPTPVYGHIPVVTHSTGQKLSKQNLAAALDNNCAIDNILAALRFLGQQLPTAEFTEPQRLLQWASSRWRRQGIPRCHRMPYSARGVCSPN